MKRGSLSAYSQFEVDIQTAAMRHNIEFMELRVESVAIWRFLNDLSGEAGEVEKKESLEAHGPNLP